MARFSRSAICPYALTAALPPSWTAGALAICGPLLSVYARFAPACMVFFSCFFALPPLAGTRSPAQHRRDGAQAAPVGGYGGHRHAVRSLDGIAVGSSTGPVLGCGRVMSRSWAPRHRRSADLDHRAPCGSDVTGRIERLQQPW